MYRVQVPLIHKVIRSLYCQFVEDGKLAEILGTKAIFSKELDQQFEYNIVESRGKLLEVPPSYTIKTAPNKSEYVSDEYTACDPTAESNVLKAVQDTTELILGLLEVGYDAESNDDEPPARYKTTKPSLLEMLIDKTLPRSLRSRKKTAKATASVYYSLANMLIVSIKAFVAAVILLETEPFVVPKTFKELQTLPKAEQQLKAVY